MLTFKTAKDCFENYLAEVEIPDSPKGLYDPVRYMLQLGGKRLRPALLLIANEIEGGKTIHALPAALAIEWFHNFTLMHDDVMDRADKRRGQLTVHKKYGLNTAILSGDIMLIQAYKFLLQTQKFIGRDLMSEFNRVATLVCEGQQLDMDFETAQNVSTEAYLDMIGKKTAALIGGSLKLGAISGGADTEKAALYEDIGFHLGLAFQLMDDYLDAFGNPEQFGKTPGGDIDMNKKTFLMINAMERADKNELEKLNKFAGLPAGHPEKVEGVLSVFEKLNIPQLTLEEINTHHRQALKSIEALNVEDSRKDALFAFADMLKQRTS